MQKQVDFNGLLDIAKRFPTEESCRDYLIESRWAGRPVCPYCGHNEKIYKINKGKTLKCAKCRKQFSVKVGTIFEDSAIPLQKWFFAIFLITAHKKGISSTQLSRDIQVTQKTAWFILHRIRYAIRTQDFSKPLENYVEIDEGFIGKQKNLKDQDKKNIVLGMVERGGEIRLTPVKDTKASTLREKIDKNISDNSIILTDDNASYRGLKKDFFHLKINHSKGYANGMIHINTIEGFWASLKRGIYGIYHHVSQDHLDKYCNEFEFKYNTRKLSDTERFIKMLNQCMGRLTYMELINGQKI